jgi:hypothetical protein
MNHRSDTLHRLAAFHRNDGGQLETWAVFPDGAVRITQFQTLTAPTADRDSRLS